jgi:hypothetical protein
VFPGIFGHRVGMLEDSCRYYVRVLINGWLPVSRERATVSVLVEDPVRSTAPSLIMT